MRVLIRFDEATYESDDGFVDCWWNSCVWVDAENTDSQIYNIYGEKQGCRVYVSCVDNTWANFWTLNKNDILVWNFLKKQLLILIIVHHQLY